MSKKIDNNKIDNNKKEYEFHGKKYVLVEGLVKGGCQGCAFIDRIDCIKLGKTNICVPEKKIFLRKIETLNK